MRRDWVGIAIITFAAGLIFIAFAVGGLKGHGFMLEAVATFIPVGIFLVAIMWVLYRKHRRRP